MGVEKGKERVDVIWERRPCYADAVETVSEFIAIMLLEDETREQQRTK